MKVAIWQVCSRHIHRRLCHRIRAGTPAQGASITSTTTRPWPCAIQPTTRAANQLVARLNIEHESIWGASYAHQMEALQTDEQITPITTIKRRTAAGRVRHRPRSFEDSGGRSPLIIKDLDLYTQPPTNNRSPTLNSEEPVKLTRLLSHRAVSAGDFWLFPPAIASSNQMPKDAAIPCTSGATRCPVLSRKHRATPRRATLTGHP